MLQLIQLLEPFYTVMRPAPPTNPDPLDEAVTGDTPRNATNCDEPLQALVRALARRAAREAVERTLRKKGDEPET